MSTGQSGATDRRCCRPGIREDFELDDESDPSPDDEAITVAFTSQSPRYCKKAVRERGVAAVVESRRGGRFRVGRLRGLFPEEAEEEQTVLTLSITRVYEDPLRKSQENRRGV